MHFYINKEFGNHVLELKPLRERIKIQLSDFCNGEDFANTNALILCFGHRNKEWKKKIVKYLVSFRRGLEVNNLWKFCRPRKWRTLSKRKCNFLLLTCRWVITFLDCSRDHESTKVYCQVVGLYTNFYLKWFSCKFNMVISWENYSI